MEGAYLQIALPPSEREGRRERFQPSMCLCVCLCEAGRSELCGATMPQSNWGRRAPIDLQGRVMKIWRCIREKQHSKCEWKTSFGTRMEKQKRGYWKIRVWSTKQQNKTHKLERHPRLLTHYKYTLLCHLLSLASYKLVYHSYLLSQAFAWVLGDDRLKPAGRPTRKCIFCGW
jgi:hypothetical protein